MPDIVTIKPKTCACGCGLAVMTRSRFRSGHDRRLVNLLVSAEKRGSMVSVDGDIFTPEEYARRVFSPVGLTLFWTLRTEEG